MILIRISLSYVMVFILVTIFALFNCMKYVVFKVIHGILTPTFCLNTRDYKINDTD